MADNGIIHDEPQPRRRSWNLQPCSCGCNVSTPFHRLRTIKAKGKGAFFVRDECIEAFKIELDARYKLEELIQSTRHLRCHRRWKFGRLMWALTYLRLNRLFGERVSRARATRQTALYCLPSWAVRIVAPRWKVAKQAENVEG